MLGMQSDMQYPHYFPGHCSTREFNLNAGCNSIWSVNNVNQIQNNGHYYNGNLAPHYIDQYSAYKEKLKQIILQHEAIFKDQIHELHRVYRRQRELMDEMKIGKCYGHHLQEETSPSNQFFPGNSFEHYQQTSKASTLPWLNHASAQSFVSGPANNQSHLNHVEGKVIQADCGKEPELPESKFKKVGKKILDLELPAYEYIDNEHEECLAWESVPSKGPGYPVKSISEDLQKNDTEISHAVEDGTVAFQNDNVARASFSLGTRCLADLNEPIQLEEEMDLESIDFPSSVSDQRETPCHNDSGEDFFVQPKETIQITQMIEDPKPSSNILPLEKSESRQECSSDNVEAEQVSNNLNSFPERTSEEAPSSSAGDNEIELAHESLTSRRKLLRKRKSVSSERCPEEVFAVIERTPNEIIPRDDSANCDSSLLTRNKHRRDAVSFPVIVQALPCSNFPVQFSRRSKFRSSQVTGIKNCVDGPKENLRSTNAQSSSYNCGDEFASEDNGAGKHIKDSIDLNLTKDIDLNCASSSSSDAAAHSTWSTDCEGRSKISATCSPSDKTNVSNLEESNKKLLLDCNSMPDSGEHLSACVAILEKKLEQKSSGYGLHVDLDSCFDGDESLPLSSLSSEIDLHPVSPENKEGCPPRGESDDNQPEMSCILSEKESGELVIEENGGLLNDLASVAAEAIVSISSSEAQNNTQDVIFKPSEVAESTSLFWFAKLAASAVDDPESEFGVVLSYKNPDDHNEYCSDGLDYFEAMTLQLKEATEEEYCCETTVQTEEVLMEAPLPGHLRRGRSRRGKPQQKEFQSKVLPSLASLSRYEVAEDLQVIGGLIESLRRSTGKSTGKNDWMMGRRRRASGLSSRAEATARTQLKQKNSHSSKCRIEEWNLISWGKLARRRSGHRCPASNPQLILGQV